jgi:hypothetical protein
MSLKSRFFRIVLILLAFFVIVGYFLFTKLLFNPFEGGLDADVTALVPRQVDFFVAKSGLQNDFDGFPRPAGMDEIEASKLWRVATGLPAYEEFKQESGVDESLAQLNEALAQLPPGINVLDVFGGRDVALAGSFDGSDLAKADWAVYGTVNWVGKLGVSLLRYPGILGLDEQGIAVRKEEDYVVLSGPNLPRELNVARMRDVVIVATQPEMITAAFDLRTKSYQDSMKQSAPYFDHIQNAPRGPQGDELELSFDVRAMLEELKVSGTWPDANSPDIMPSLFGKYFQLGSLKNALGVVGYDDGLFVDMHAELSSELISPVQKRLHRMRGFDRETLLSEAAAFAPADSSALVYLRADVGDLLKQVLSSLEPATRDLIEDTFRNTGAYSSLDKLVEELDGAFKDRAVLIVRPNDYPEEVDGPPHTDDPVFTFALILWTNNLQTVEDLRELIGQNGARFGLRGLKPGDPGYFTNDVGGGFRIHEFWSEFVPGTGVVAMTAANVAGGVTIVSNSHRMLGHILKTYTQGGPRYPQLAENGQFIALVNSSVPRANATVYLNPRTAAPTLRVQAERNARYSIQVDWKQQRALLEDQVLREHFPGQRRGQLTPTVQEQVDAMVDPMLVEKQKNVMAQQVPAIVERRNGWIEMSESIPAALWMLALDPKSLDLSVRIPVDLSE